jgi:hypothetical protein
MLPCYRIDPCFLTVFSPTDEAFKLLPGGTVESPVKPDNKATLIKDGNGTAELKTVAGVTD